MKTVGWNHGKGFEWRDDINPDGLLSFADDRIVLLGSNLNRLMVDNCQRQLNDVQYKFLHTLVQSVDKVVPHSEIVSSVYGWEDPSPSTVHSFLKTISSHTHKVRRELGTELGDPEYGAIRSAGGLGLTALSSLQS